MTSNFLMRCVFWFAVVLIGTLAMTPTAYLQDSIFNWWDKAQYVLAFALLMWLGLLAYPLARGQLLAGLLLYGLCIELAQHLSGWRVGDWRDAIADAAGVCVVWALKRARSADK